MSFVHLLTEIVYVASETARDGYGDATFGTARALKAAISHSQSRVMSIDGDERISSQKVDTAEEIKAGDRVWFPGEDPATDVGRVPMALVNEKSPRSGRRLYVTYF